MHLERRRYFGHPELVKTILAIGRTVEEEDLGILFVGDLAQARGGPTPTSHLSHQNGLDVDVWFTLERDLLKQLDAFRANVSAPSLLNGPGTELKRFLWKAENARVLEFAAKRPSVDRIFVNPHIKNELCRTAPKNDRSWLRKIRPWWGHHDHFHMRLACPPGNPQCVSQKPLPEGDGCGQALDWWLHLQNTMRSPGSKAPRNIGIGRMPGSCSKVLSE
jgi:penicillin-insensitive murein endopeptidase